MPYTSLHTKKGFTLVEILVATTILVIAMASIYMSFRGGVTSWTKGTVRMERYLNARAALDMMSREIGAAIIAAYGIYEIDFVGYNATATVGGETVDDDSLNFVAPVRGDVDEPDLRKVRYQLDGVNRELERATDDSIDDDITSFPPPTPLTENVKSLNFEYYDSDIPGWRNYWDSRTTSERGGIPEIPETVNTLPDAVKITIAVQDELRHEAAQIFSTIVYLPTSR